MISERSPIHQPSSPRNLIICYLNKYYAYTIILRHVQSLVCLECMVKGKTKEIRNCNGNPNSVKPSYLDQNSFGLR